MTAEDQLTAAGLVLPTDVGAAANYVPFVRHGDVVYVSGQLPRLGSAVTTVGKVGRDVEVGEAEHAARICALRILAIMRKAAGGSLDRVEQVIELTVYVNSAATFTDQSQVADAASALMVQVFGAKGRHARAAIGVAQLPKNASVEIKAVFAVAGRDK